MILAIVQARMDSSRFPGKVLKKINNLSIIEILFRRLSKSNMIDKIILATSDLKSNDELAFKVKESGFDIFRGSENNVLQRYYRSAKLYNAKIIVRITGDCPLIDFLVVDKVIKLFINNNVDYASNINPPTYPDGLDVEVFSMRALDIANKKAKTRFDKEHVTPFIRSSNKFEKINLFNNYDHSNLRWTLDEELDFKLIGKIFNHFSPSIHFSYQNILNLKKKILKFLR